MPHSIIPGNLVLPPGAPFPTITASVDWCEPNYVKTHHVAEFFNTLSSVPITLLGLAFVRQCLQRGDELRFLLVALAITVIGIGSMAFHGTLQRWGQVLDEVPMVWAANGALYVALTLRGGPRPALATGIALWTAAATVVYFLAGFEFFIVLYVISVASVFSVVLWQSGRATDPRTRAQHRLFAGISAALYTGGFLLLWIPEMIWCGNRLERTDLGNNWLEGAHLHAYFHLTSAVAPYFFMCFAALAWRDDQLRRHSVKWEQIPETFYLVRLPVVRDV